MDQYLEKLDAFFKDLFIEKAPSLPKNAKEWIVKVAPWLVLVFGLMALPGILAILGFGAITAPIWVFSRHSPFYLFGATIGIIQIILELVAVPHLFKRDKRGWKLLYWSGLLGLLASIVQLSVSSLIFVVIGLYFLYQVKEYYN